MTPSAVARTPAIASDLVLLRERIVAMHPNPWRRVSRVAFDKAADNLARRLPTLDRPHAIVGMMQLLASLQDGHTTIPAVQPRAGLLILPLRLRIYGDALYIDGCDRRYAAALGAQVSMIGGTPVAEAIRRLRTITPGDNAMSVANRLPGYAISPTALAGLDIVRDARAPVVLTLVKDGKSVPLSVTAVEPSKKMVYKELTARYSEDWVEAEPARPPLWQENPEKAYWYRFDQSTDTLFVQYNASTNDPADPMPTFAKRLRAEIETRKPVRVVLDLRMNAGGDAYWNRPLLLALLHADELEATGKLFVLIGKQNFSAGTLLAIDLEKYSSAIFIGEPTGGSIQSFGDHQPVILPTTGLLAMVATLAYQNNGPRDDRPWLAPQMAIDAAPEDAALGRDRVFEAVLHYRPPAELLRASIDGQPADKAEQAYSAFMANSAWRYLDAEPLITSVGYALIGAGDLKRAVATMKVGVAHYPKVADAYDSLGNALRAAGDFQAAIANYRQALIVNPGWQHSRQALVELGVAP
jgi:hypothetical protein